MIHQKKLIQIVANNLNLPTKLVHDVYWAYWKVYRNKIIDLPLKEDLTKEEFDKLQTNFNIPSIGKLTCTYDRYKNKKKQFEYIKNNKKDEQTES